MTRKTLFTLAAASLALTACQSMGGMSMRSMEPQGQPGIPFSGVRPDPGNQLALDALMALQPKPIHALEPVEARRQPSFADGVKAAAGRTGARMPPMTDVAVRDISVGGTAGNLRAKLYTPAGVSGLMPVIVYYHGGGWVLADPMVYDASTRALAREARAMVISVDYRRAPEAKFPAQHDDALAAYRWTVANARSLGGDTSRIALAGESAGGNLAVATAIAARDNNVQAPAHVLTIYPIAGSDLNTPSYRDSANAMPLNRAQMAWFLHHTTRSPADAMDSRINLVKANLRGLPPVTLIQAEIDPLRSEGTMLADRMRAAGVRVTSRMYPGTTHEFFGGDAVIADAREAQMFAGAQLRAAFQR